MTKDSQHWDKRYAEEGMAWSAEPNQFVAQLTTDLAPGRALDLATGEGRNAIWLAQRGWRVTGVDFSRVGLDKAARLAERQGSEVAARLTWEFADAVTYRAPGAFDLVLVVYLHLEPAERGRALRNAAGALAPGGTLLVIGHHTDNIEHGAGGPQDAEVLYTEDDVVADVAGVADLELTVQRSERVERHVEGKPRPALDVLVEMRRT